MKLLCSLICLLLVSFQALAGNWPQAAGPNANWQVEDVADPVTEWSVVRNENVLWRTVLPEGGQSAVTIWGDKAFVTTHRPIEEGGSMLEPNMVGYCLDANTGETLWQVNVPGTDPVQVSGIFSDATVFAPIADEGRVWFFNRCGAIGCYDHSGKEIWLRKYQPRPRHTTRQCEPVMVGDTILTVEVKNKELGQRLKRHKPVPEGIEPREVWCYLHGIDKNTGEVKWVGEAGTAVGNTPTVKQLADGSWAVAHGRGGGHGPLEKPYGPSLTSFKDGKEIWTIDLGGADAVMNMQWNENELYWFQKQEQIVFSTETGEELRRFNVSESVDVCRYDEKAGDWKSETGVTFNKGKKIPHTNQTNIVVGDWHYFLAHDAIAIGRSNVKTGATEYLQVPAQLVVKANGQDSKIWEKKDAISNDMKNSRGVELAPDKRARGTGFGHVSAASPIRVNQYLFFPIMNGTVFVIDTRAEKLNQEALMAINDLGPAGETWTLASFSYANGRLFMHTMKEVICLGEAE
ncbi:MAG: PQQ-binding-like beta-propeller repeat protein [Verrucomicrobiales bacterium]